MILLCFQGSKSGMPRTVFTRKQLTRLEERFIAQTFLSKEERQSLASELKLTERQIMVWFQNRRLVNLIRYTITGIGCGTYTIEFSITYELFPIICKLTRL